MSTERDNLSNPIVRKPDTACIHCGLTVPEALLKPERHEQFCCAGCEAVWTILHQCGLEEYYRLREAYETDSRRPAQISGKSFDYLDDPDFLKKYAAGRTQGGLRFSFYLDGVHCVACSWLVEKVLMEREGAAFASLNLGKSVVEIVFDPTRVQLSALARALDRLGYTPHPIGEESIAEAARKETRRLIARMGIAGASAGNIMLLAVSTYFGEYSGMDAGVASLFRWISLGLALPAVTYSAWPFYKGAWHGLKQRALHMDLPISLGILAAFAISLAATILERGEVYFDSVSMLVFLLLAGRLVLNRAGRWAANASENLLRLEAKTARRMSNSQETIVPLSEIRVDDQLHIYPSETVPVDGIVVAGTGYITQAHLTGEAAPLKVETGDTVYAGSVAVVSPFVMMAMQVGESTRLHQLANLMRDAAKRRAPVIALTDRIAGYFVAAVLVLATTTAIYWWLHDPTKALWNTAAMLVVTCPCALGLATPIALGMAMGRAARKGIFIRGADGVERLASVEHVILDKTGTLTTGELSLSEQHYLPEFTKHAKNILAAVAAIEAQSGHVFARAFADYVRPSLPAIDIQSVSGKGVRGYVDGHEFAVGSPSYLQQLGLNVPFALQEIAHEASRTGQSICLVARDQQVAALYVLADRTHKKAQSAVTTLKSLGLSLEVLSGDAQIAVEQTARALGIEQCRGQITPEQKLARVRELQSQGRKVAMAGDGINDSAALSAATVGISAAGAAEIARDAADVFISGRGPDAVAEAVALSRRALRIVMLNIAIGIAYNLIGATLAFSGVVTPLSAAILMPLSSLTALLIATRA